MESGATSPAVPSRPPSVYVIGDPAAARRWLLRAIGPFSLVRAPRPGTVVVLAMPGQLVPRGQVGQARRLAALGHPVWVVSGASSLTPAVPWLLASWARDRSEQLRLVVRQPARLRTGTGTGAAGEPRLPGKSPAGRQLATGAVTDEPARRRVPRRSTVATRLAGKGPAVAAYLDRQWAEHHRAPEWSSIAVALAWPGDEIDHDRALHALGHAGWIDISATDAARIARPGPRWTDSPLRSA